MGSLQQAKQSAINLNTPSGEMLVTYMHQEESGMSYVSAQPMSIVLTTVNIYRNIMLLVIAVSLIVGLLLCCHQARKLSAPSMQNTPLPAHCSCASMVKWSSCCPGNCASHEGRAGQHPGLVSAAPSRLHPAGRKINLLIG